MTENKTAEEALAGCLRRGERIRWRAWHPKADLGSGTAAECLRRT